MTEPTTAPPTTPTAGPTAGPSPQPTAGPSPQPSPQPTAGPSPQPTAGPSPQPTTGPTTQPTRLPPLVGEDHSCDRCGLRYPELTVAHAAAIIAEVPGRARAVSLPLPEPKRRHRQRPRTWSVLEYVCHLRDVYMTSTIRLHRTRTEHEPALEPMYNELRARRFGYNTLDLAAVLDELAAAVAGFLDEVGRVGADQWDRTATRQPGERRTALWLVRQAAHEGTHHLRDITDLASDPNAR